MDFVVLVLLLYFERFVIILWDGFIEEDNRSFLYGPKLVEIAIEKDDEDIAEVFLISTKLVELFIHSV